MRVTVADVVSVKSTIAVALSFTAKLVLGVKVMFNFMLTTLRARVRSTFEKY